MDYSKFKSEYLNLCARFGRDTKRKIANDLKSDVKELEYQIASLEPRLEVNPTAYLYGELHTRTKLRKIKTELQFSKQLLTEI
jgi:hypothetical protein